MADKTCPYCGVDYERARIFGLVVNYVGTCFFCGRTVHINGVAFYSGEHGTDGGVHNFTLSYPFMCDCGRFHSVLTIFCKPIDVTQEFAGIKKGNKHDEST